MRHNFHQLSQTVLDNIERKLLDVPYCDSSPLQILDLYYPNGEQKGALPLIVYIHGGAFANGDQREDHLEPVLRGLERGYAVASIQYRRSSEALFPAQLYDAKAAIRYLRANGGTLGLDTERFCVWGASSGTWIASMVGVTAGNPAFEDPNQGNEGVDSSVGAVVDWCGPCGGFLEMDKELQKSGAGTPDHSLPDSPESHFLGRTITEVPELDRLACPCTYVHSGMPPVCIVHGGADQVVPVEQSQRFYDEIVKKAGADRAQLHIEEGGLHHGDPWYNDPWVAQLCLDFLDRELDR